jgi:hypothetical protein
LLKLNPDVDAKDKPGHDERRHQEAVGIAGWLLRAYRAARSKRMSGSNNVICERREAIHRSSFRGHAKREPQRQLRTGNLEIPGSMLRIAPE